MIRWKYELKETGVALRELLDECDVSEANCLKILQQIIACCEYLKPQLTDDDQEYYGEDLDDLIEECKETKSYIDEYDEESNEDNINDMLDKFYDLMDLMRVWVTL